MTYSFSFMYTQSDGVRVTCYFYVPFPDYKVHNTLAAV
jgi:hypothetical protein